MSTLGLAVQNKWQKLDVFIISLPVMNTVIKTKRNEIKCAEYSLQIFAIKILLCKAVSLS